LGEVARRASARGRREAGQLEVHARTWQEIWFCSIRHDGRADETTHSPGWRVLADALTRYQGRLSRGPPDARRANQISAKCGRCTSSCPASRCPWPGPPRHPHPTSATPVPDRTRPGRAAGESGPACRWSWSMGRRSSGGQAVVPTRNQPQLYGGKLLVGVPAAEGRGRRVGRRRGREANDIRSVPHLLPAVREGGDRATPVGSPTASSATYPAPPVRRRRGPLSSSGTRTTPVSTGPDAGGRRGDRCDVERPPEWGWLGAEKQGSDACTCGGSPWSGRRRGCGVVTDLLDEASLPGRGPAVYLTLQIENVFPTDHRGVPPPAADRLPPAGYGVPGRPCAWSCSTSCNGPRVRRGGPTRTGGRVGLGGADLRRLTKSWSGCTRC